MTTILKQSTTTTIILGPFLDDTDGKTAETGLSIAQADVRLSKNGWTFAQKNSSTATAHNELGYYKVHLNATDTNTLGSLKVVVSKSGALPVWADFQIVTENVYDAVCGLYPLEVDLVSYMKDYILNPLNAFNSKVDNLHETIKYGFSRQMIVSGAGTDELNGDYIEEGTNDGKPKYQLYDGDGATGVHLIWNNFNEGSWIISNIYSPESEPFYYSTEDVATPDLCETWAVFEGTAPVPTVTIGEIISLAKSSELIPLAKTSDLSELEETLEEVKDQTDQLVFADGKVNANAIVDLAESDIAKQSTSQEILSKFADVPVEIISTIVDGNITAIRGNDWDIAIPCELPEDAKYQIALKRNVSYEDSRSTLFVSSDGGLQTLNGNAPISSTDASLAYNDVTQTLTLIVKASATKQFEPGKYRYGIQTVKNDNVKESYQGKFAIVSDVVRATG